MPIDRSSEENIPDDTETYYEAVASQEEIYLEEVEEELRAILIFGDPSPSPKEAERSLSNNDPRCAGSLDEKLDHAAEDLITDDSNDPPLSEEAVAEMLRMSQITKWFRPDT